MTETTAQNGDLSASAETPRDDAFCDLARVKITSPVSIVVPTYKERENLPELVERIGRLREACEIELELLLMDDNSDDGTREWVDECGVPWVRLIERDGPRGLSPAVLEGMREAKYPVIVVMDADLSHPPEKIPDLILPLQAGQELVIGSRYVDGGSTDADWGFFRWLNSLIATKLAMPLTSVSDPMAGFFALRKSVLDRADYLNPVGYKIGLEVIVRCRLTNVGEVPIHFTDRVLGESKLSFKEQLKYIQHLRRLYIYKFGPESHMFQFMIVGASGVVVNLLVLYALVWMSVSEMLAVAGGILVSLLSNFMLNRRFFFGYAREQPLVAQLFRFLRACSIGAGVNFIVTLGVLKAWEQAPLWLAVMSGIAAGMLFNRFYSWAWKPKWPHLRLSR